MSNKGWQKPILPCFLTAQMYTHFLDLQTGWKSGFDVNKLINGFAILSHDYYKKNCDQRAKDE
jgi:hypothetical protein